MDTLTNEEFLGELLFQLISDGKMHPDHRGGGRDIYSELIRRVGDKAESIMNTARLNAPLPMPVSIDVHALDPFPANTNPFLNDISRMGTKLGSNVYVMYVNFPDDKMDYLIIYNKNTGERIHVRFWG